MAPNAPTPTSIARRDEQAPVCAGGLPVVLVSDVGPGLHVSHVSETLPYLSRA